MQKFYKDKSKLFECNISVDGAKLADTKARLVLEFPNNKSLLFRGKINENGKCKIVIPPLKEIEEITGKAVLEIIAESTYFESWQDEFQVESSKKITVEMVEEKDEIIETKITPHVEVITQKEEKPVEDKKPKQSNLTEFKDFADKNKMNISEIIKDKTLYTKALLNFKKTNSLTKAEILKLHDDIVLQHVNKLL